MEKILLAIKNAGMRKMSFALIALFVIAGLCFGGKLKDDYFRECFIALIGFVMGANYGEHNAKSKEAKDAIPVAPVV